MFSQTSRVPHDFKDKRVCIFGLGFVGLTLATVMADAGFNVIGIETKEEILEKISSGNAHFFEPGLSEYLKRILISGNLTVFKSLPEKINATVYVISVGTPLDSSRKVNLNSITSVASEIASVLNDGDLVILRSTVKLGTTREIVKPILDASGKFFDLAFCPERTIEGQALSELRHLPQIIGGDSLSASLRASHIFQFLTPTVVKVSNLETAEMVKLVDNTKRDVSFAYANEIAKICNHIGMNVEEVITSGRFGYSRTDIPLPGPVGGPCLSKDSYILEQSLDKFGIRPNLIMTARKVNEDQVLEVSRFINHITSNMLHFPNKPKIALLGLAFKGRPETDDLRGTVAIDMLEELKKCFPEGEFWGFDPVVHFDDIQSMGLYPVSNVYDALHNANLVVILNNHLYFSKLNLNSMVAKIAKPGVIYDFWNTYKDQAVTLVEGKRYIVLGDHQHGACLFSSTKNKNVDIHHTESKEVESIF